MLKPIQQFKYRLEDDGLNTSFQICEKEFLGFPQWETVANFNLQNNRWETHREDIISVLYNLNGKVPLLNKNEPTTAMSNW